MPERERERQRRAREHDRHDQQQHVDRHAELGQGRDAEHGDDRRSRRAFPSGPGRSICSASRSTWRRAISASSTPPSSSTIATSSRGRNRMPAFSESDRNSRPEQRERREDHDHQQPDPDRAARSRSSASGRARSGPARRWRRSARPSASSPAARSPRASTRRISETTSQPTISSASAPARRGRNPPSSSPARSRTVASVIAAGMPGTSAPAPRADRRGGGAEGEQGPADGTLPARGAHHRARQLVAVRGRLGRPARRAACAARRSAGVSGSGSSLIAGAPSRTCCGAATSISSPRARCSAP